MLYQTAKPYITLTRINKPIGIWLLAFPCLFSITLAPHNTLPYYLYIVFIIGALLMRSAGCVINDIVDRNIDAQVKRTKNRPLAKKTIKLWEAYALAGILLLIACLLLLTLNKLTLIIGLCSVFPIILYPFSKRFTHWPQAILGVTFNLGAIMAWTASTGGIHIAAIAVYIGCIAWTLAYDTIYSHQDKNDDIRIGIKSTALFLNNQSKFYLLVFYSIFIAALWFAAVSVDHGMSFHIALIISSFYIFRLVNKVDLDQPKSCMRAFIANRTLGLILIAGLLAGKWVF